MNGIQQWVRLALDRAAAAKTEEELKQALKRGTDPKAAEQNLGRIEKRFDSLVGVAKKGAAAMAGFFALRQVGAFAAEMFQLGSAAEETGSKFATTFGGASKQVQSFIDDWARLAGLNRTVGQEMTATAGAIVQGMGMSQEASAAFSERMLRLAGDMQSFHNVPIGETFTAIKAGLVGSWEPLDRFGIVLRQADVDTRALTETGKSNASALTQQEKAVAALSLMYERAGPALGDLERTQDSTANRARALQADFQNLKINLANELMPTFARLVQFLDENRGSITTFGQQAAKAVEVIGAELRAFARDLEMVGNAWRALNNAFAQGASVPGPLGGIFRLLGAKTRIKGTGTTQDMRSDNERERALGTSAGTAGTTTPPKPTTGTGTGTGRRTSTAAANRAARDRAREAKEAKAAKEAEEERQRALQDREKADRDFGLDPDRPRLNKGGSNRGFAVTNIISAYDKEQERLGVFADVWREKHRDMENATQNVAAGIMDSFGQAVEMMITGAGSIGDAFVGVGAGIARDILGGLKQLATGKVVENVAWAFEKFAHGNIPQGTAFLLSAAKWTAAGGVAAGLGGAMGGIGRGGGGNVHRGGGVYGRQASERVEVRPPEVHVYNNFTLDPTNPNTARFIYRAQNTGVELAGRPDWAKK